MKHDAVVVGSGPNGLAAAITLARAGRSVQVLEAAETFGGGMRTQELTLPGFLHDVCSTVQPLAVSSPFFTSLPLERHGLRWVHPPLPLVHLLTEDHAAVLHRSSAATAAGLGSDRDSWERLFGPFVRDWGRLAGSVLGPMLRIPPYPLLMARFGMHGLRSAAGLASARFSEEEARVLFAGCAAHAEVPLGDWLTAAFGLVLTTSAQGAGWPFAAGGSRSIANALAGCLRSLGGEIVTGRPVRSLGDLPPARAVLLDVTPRQLLAIANDRLRGRYRRQIEKYRYGPGVFKVDWALAGPVPWRSAAARQSGTVHLGGTLDDIMASEEAVHSGHVPERPFMLTTQPSLFDQARAPAGKHTFWAYCHVPNGCDVDMTERIEAQVERFAPGFRDLILARHTMGPGALERHNPNLVGGDIAGGSSAGLQLFFRPAVRLSPYSTPIPGLYLSSSSTPPGGGVHGMSGYWAAQTALRRSLGG